MSKHTPGPWRISGDAGHAANIRITSVARRHIAKVYAESIAQDPVCEANARLIASAPDLLDALQALTSMFHPNTQYVNGHPAAEKARAAIRKATGEQQ
jgi:hypothetical protein